MVFAIKKVFSESGMVRKGDEDGCTEQRAAIAARSSGENILMAGLCLGDISGRCQMGMSSPVSLKPLSLGSDSVLVLTQLGRMSRTRSRRSSSGHSSPGHSSNKMPLKYLSGVVAVLGGASKLKSLLNNSCSLMNKFD